MTILLTIAVVVLALSAVLQMNPNLNVKSRHGNRVYNPVARTLITALCLVMVPLLFVFLLVTLPITVPLNIILKKAGRQGFLRQEGRSYSWSLDAQAFRRQA